MLDAVQTAGVLAELYLTRWHAKRLRERLNKEAAKLHVMEIRIVRLEQMLEEQDARPRDD